MIEIFIPTSNEKLFERESSYDYVRQEFWDWAENQLGERSLVLDTDQLKPNWRWCCIPEVKKLYNLRVDNDRRYWTSGRLFIFRYKPDAVLFKLTWIG